MSTPPSEISITANGKPYAVAPGCSLPDFVEARGLAIDRVVVERNGAALTPAEARRVVLADGDALEIVRIVAGG